MNCGCKSTSPLTKTFIFFRMLAFEQVDLSADLICFVFLFYLLAFVIMVLVRNILKYN